MGGGASKNQGPQQQQQPRRQNNPNAYPGQQRDLAAGAGPQQQGGHGGGGGGHSRRPNGNSRRPHGSRNGNGGQPGGGTAPNVPPGPQRHPGEVPPGPHSAFYNHMQQQMQQQQQAQASLPPEVAETETIVNSVHMERSTLQLREVSEGMQAISFKYTADVPAEVILHIAIEEKGDPATNGETPLFVPQDNSFPNHLPAGSLKPGQDMDFVSLATPLDLSTLAPYMKHNDSPQQRPLYPVVITLQYNSKEKNTPFFQHTYAEVLLEADPPRIHPIRQRLQVGANLYELEDIYGSPEGHAADGGGAEDFIEDVEDGDDQCVVCISEDRDTIVMPCRHLCLCGECARMLRQQSNKCPICRTPIERLITRKVTRSDQLPPATRAQSISDIYEKPNGSPAAQHPPEPMSIETAEED